MVANAPKSHIPSSAAGNAARTPSATEAQRQAVLAQLVRVKARSEQPERVAEPLPPPQEGLLSGLRKELAEEWEDLLSTRAGKRFVVGSAAALVFVTGALAGAVLTDSYHARERKKNAVAEKRAKDRASKAVLDESGRAVLPAASSDASRDADSFAGVDLSGPEKSASQPSREPSSNPLPKPARDRSGALTVSGPEDLKALGEALKSFSEQDAAPPAKNGNPSRDR